MNFYKQQLCLLAFLILMIGKVSAQLSMPSVFSSNMVLQREQKVPVWGKAKPKETIQIHFGKQHLKTKADVNGKWQVELLPMNGEKTAKQLIVKGKDSTIVFENVVVGEVWLCSGQSNMEYSVKRNPNFLAPMRGDDMEAIELTKPLNSLLRVFNQNRNGRSTSWLIADGNTIGSTSSAGYFFAKQIQEKLDIPVGLITVAYGGSQIETWTTTAMYEQNPYFANALKENDGRIDGISPGNNYKSLIERFVPFSLKGFLWYQGENNCGKGDSHYADKFQILVNSWRNEFNAPDAPFYCVLLAPHIYSDRKHNNKTTAITAEGLPLFREQQKKGVSLVTNSDYVVTTDLVDKLTDIHPPYKWEVGARLARLALAKNYGCNELEYSGPRVCKTEIVADSVIITFSHVGDGLKTNDDKRVSWFEIAAENGIFRPAFAEVRDKNKIVVFLPEIKQPSKVRFGWHETAMPNLVNSEGLPATPFNCN